MNNLNPVWIREQFPSLEQRVDTTQAVYFDGPGGTQVPKRVMEAVNQYYLKMNSNIEGAFLTSRKSDQMLINARNAMADFLNARSAKEISFGLNMTTHTFNISRAIGKSLKPGDEIIVTVLDHEANVSPWNALIEYGIKVNCIDIRTEDCTLDLEDLESKLNERTKVVALGYASNAVGTINPVREIIRKAHQVGALVFVDAVHYAPHGPIDVQDLDCDFLACSTYKFFGPHLGVLYGKQEILDQLPAYKVRPAYDRFEIGTQNHEGIVGAMAAIEYLADVGDHYGKSFLNQYQDLEGRRLKLKTGLSVIEYYEKELMERLLAGLEEVPEVKIWGITDRSLLHQRTPTLGFTVTGFSPRKVAESLGCKGFFLWDGDFYAQALIERLGLLSLGGLVRLGLVHYNTSQEIDRFLFEIKRLVRST